MLQLLADLPFVPTERFRLQLRAAGVASLHPAGERSGGRGARQTSGGSRGSGRGHGQCLGGVLLLRAMWPRHVRWVGSTVPLRT